MPSPSAPAISCPWGLGPSQACTLRWQCLLMPSFCRRLHLVLVRHSRPSPVNGCAEDHVYAMHSHPSLTNMYGHAAPCTRTISVLWLPIHSEHKSTPSATGPRTFLGFLSPPLSLSTQRDKRTRKITNLPFPFSPRTHWSYPTLMDLALLAHVCPDEL